MTKANPVVWFEALGADPEKLRRFYGEMLGWQFAVDPKTGYGVVEGGCAGDGIAGGVGFTPPGQRGWVAFYVQVDDLADALERARGLGSQVMLPPVHLDDTTIAVVSDPEGRPLGLCAPA